VTAAGDGAAATVEVATVVDVDACGAVVVA
jgi:hypothetical protein